MILYDKKKIDNAICFFALEHKKATRQHLYQTFLYKYLALLDFQSFEETGSPVLGLEYKAMEKGPVPIAIYSHRHNFKTDCCELKQLENNQYVVVVKVKPDLSYFSPYEINIMQNLITIYANKFIKTGLISDATHEKIIAWQKTWLKKPNTTIDYELTFEDNFMDKEEKELNLAEEHYLIQKAIEKS